MNKISLLNHSKNYSLTSQFQNPFNNCFRIVAITLQPFSANNLAEVIILHPQLMA
jgi:hypothetical protein